MHEVGRRRRQRFINHTKDKNLSSAHGQQFLPRESKSTPSGKESKEETIWRHWTVACLVLGVSKDISMSGTFQETERTYATLRRQEWHEVVRESEGQYGWDTQWEKDRASW